MKRCVYYALFFIFACLSFSFISQAGQTGKFSIKGKLTGFENGTWLYLNNSVAGKTMDSAQVVNGVFTINGALPDSTNDLQVVIHTKTYSDYLYFWIGRGTTIFTGEKGKFREAKITGSTAQLMNEKYMEVVKPYRNRQDSINKMYRLPNPDTNKLKLLVEETGREELAASEIFIKQHPRTIVSAYILSIYGTKMGKKAAQALYKALSAENQNSLYGKKVKEFIDLNKDVRVGDRFVDIEQMDSSGKKMRLSDFKGKYVLLEFWASNCGPCRRENPDMVKMYNVLKGKGFEIFAVSLDVNKRMWKAAIATDGLNWINVSELNGQDNTAALAYGVYEMPTNFLINREGKIVAKNLRGKDLEKELIKLLN